LLRHFQLRSAQQSNSETAETVLVVPLTSDTDGKQRLPMPVIAPDPGNGLLQRSAAMCGRVSCIRKARLNQRIGAVHPQELRRVRLGVAAVIGLTDLLTAASIERASRP
jgi:mRNA interferase MazF